MEEHLYTKATDFGLHGLVLFQLISVNENSDKDFLSDC